MLFKDQEFDSLYNFTVGHGTSRMSVTCHDSCVQYRKHLLNVTGFLKIWHGKLRGHANHV